MTHAPLRLISAVSLTLVAATAHAAPTVASASASAVAAVATPATTAPPAPARSIYRLDITVSGLDGSALPTPYTMIVEEGQRGELSTGANIPLVIADQAHPGEGPRQNIGLELKLRYELRGGIVVLDGSVELSSADPATRAMPATIHRLRATSTVPVTPGTPALFTSLVDLASHKRTDITVSAQRLL